MLYGTCYVIWRCRHFWLIVSAPTWTLNKCRPIWFNYTYMSNGQRDLSINGDITCHRMREELLLLAFPEFVSIIFLDRVQLAQVFRTMANCLLLTQIKLPDMEKYKIVLCESPQIHALDVWLSFLPETLLLFGPVEITIHYSSLLHRGCTCWDPSSE